ncbi:hypothetical protein [Microbacterium sp. Marseille-Q6965]|uniref:hypothetical protein n=1 Tax=Microbacterium sp. Marseille-Q6965 TaxID=2965072 RepID=UPI0021B7224C|nr:hypothetical protein [Microbacterium sp. Marseille-Q6965]
MATSLYSASRAAVLRGAGVDRDSSASAPAASAPSDAFFAAPRAVPEPVAPAALPRFVDGRVPVVRFAEAVPAAFVARGFRALEEVLVPDVASLSSGSPCAASGEGALFPRAAADRPVDEPAPPLRAAVDRAPPERAGFFAGSGEPGAAASAVDAASVAAASEGGSAGASAEVVAARAVPVLLRAVVLLRAAVLRAAEPAALPAVPALRPEVEVDRARLAEGRLAALEAVASASGA